MDSADRRYMHLALRLARAGMGRTHPNPRVGAVAVRDGRLVGLGAHLRQGAAHAEVLLFETADAACLRGATLYVSLEPCVHRGKVGACAPRVLAAGFRRVVVAMRDPNPTVFGRGLAALERGGLEVECGVCAGEAAELNAPFIWLQRLGRAHLRLKVAGSLDGRLAAPDGSSRWISGPRAREQVHRWRASCDAILVGRGTFVKDRPSLTARPAGDPLCRLRRRLHGAPPWPHQPARVVVDSRARVGTERDLIAHMSGAGGRWIVACGDCAPAGSLQRLRSAGIACWVIGATGGGSGVDLSRLAERLAEEGLLDILVEGGAALATELLRLHLVDRMHTFVAPLLLGGPHTWARDIGVAALAEAPRLAAPRLRRLGDDILCDGFLPAAAALVEEAAAAGGGARSEAPAQ